eukprot:scaffold294048_cov22-Tisochrysis_lutea.AAC.3
MPLSAQAYRGTAKVARQSCNTATARIQGATSLATSCRAGHCLPTVDLNKLNFLAQSFAVCPKMPTLVRKRKQATMPPRSRSLSTPDDMDSHTAYHPCYMSVLNHDTPHGNSPLALDTPGGLHTKMMRVAGCSPWTGDSSDSQQHGWHIPALLLLPDSSHDL